MAALALSPPLHAEIGAKSSRFLVRFIAISTVVRSAWSGNQDVYLVELREKSRGVPFLAKLIDEYPGYGSAIPRRLLVSNATSLIKVRRDQECDVRYGDMPKHAGPGDSMATYLSPLTSIPNIYLQVDRDVIVECFRLVRQ